MFNQEIYAARRQQLKAAVKQGLILLLANEESSMNYKDNLYHFRQDSSFLYFIGIDRPSLAAVIDIDKDREIVFGNELTMDDIIWTGPRETIREQAAKSGIHTVQPLSDLDTLLQQARAAGQTIHFLPPYRADNAQKLSDWLDIPYAALKSRASVPLIKAIVAQRSIKSDLEVAEIEKAVGITVDMQLEAIRSAREGMTETEIAGRVQGVAVSAGGNLSFPIILTVNGQILHNHYQQTVLQSGQMVLCDCGAETDMHYAGDLTRTFPVDGAFTPLQKTVYEIVAAAQQRAIDALRPGILFRDVHLLACEQLAEGLRDIGLMKGDVKEAVAQGAHALFFQCGLGHMMGLDVHDMEDLGEAYVGYTEDLQKSTAFGLKSLRLGRALEPGFVLTVEPGLYFIPELIDEWQAAGKFTDFINYDKVQAFKNFGGIRIEEDFLITENGSRLLGKPLYKTAAGIEALR
ncbi:aminopeptidase P family protein [Chitinophaga japonensis]|uniref:Xaa-Pro aminopeptidase n=1 Tax=Chitinophaga japonensis TaxID=104662 RepID=A0A562SZG9_CHIJA|nr:aminopeptidase P family protein [Chitinophaga japonensis]TWI86652.1 Xaa-Pro aminopeptidase [Chitinophaga japonensis]